MPSYCHQTHRKPTGGHLRHSLIVPALPPTRPQRNSKGTAHCNRTLKFALQALTSDIFIKFASQIREFFSTDDHDGIIKTIREDHTSVADLKSENSNLVKNIEVLEDEKSKIYTEIAKLDNENKEKIAQIQKLQDHINSLQKDTSFANAVRSLHSLQANHEDDNDLLSVIDENAQNISKYQEEIQKLIESNRLERKKLEEYQKLKKLAEEEEDEHSEEAQEGEE